jgi:hypothetical protein
LGYDIANQHARDWWLAFEEANRDNISVIVELCTELTARGMGIEEFFGVYVHSEAKSVPELLALIDRLIEERRAAENKVESASVNTASIVEDVVADDSVSPPGIPVASEYHPEEYHPNGNGTHTETDSVPLNAKVEVVNHFITPKEERRLATLQVKLDGYLEIGADLLAQGKTAEYRQLLELIRSENELPPELFAELQALAGNT